MPVGGNDDEETTSALPPRRTHSLKAPPTKSHASSIPGNGLAAAFDFDDDDYDDDKEITNALVKETSEVLQRVEDGWSADELRGVVTKLVGHVQHLVCTCSVL